MGAGQIEALPARLRAKIELAQGHWLWTGTRTRGGYGLTTLGGRRVAAHRAVYTLLVGEIPPGMELDHLCKIRHCVNPACLEPVTSYENKMRSGSIPAQIKRAGLTPTPRTRRPTSAGSAKRVLTAAQIEQRRQAGKARAQGFTSESQRQANAAMREKYGPQTLRQWSRKGFKALAKRLGIDEAINKIQGNSSGGNSNDEIPF